MVKSLIDKFRNIGRGTARFIAGGLASAVLLTLVNACNPFLPAVPDLNTSPNSGSAPVEAHVNLKAKNSAIKYILGIDYGQNGIDKTITQDTPISLDEMLTSTTDYHAWVVGTDGATSGEVIQTIKVLSPGNHAPVVTSVPKTSINEGEFYSYTITGTDGDGDVLTPDWPKYASWMTKSGNTISGTAPQVDADTNVDIDGSLSDGKATTEQPYILTIKNVVSGNHAPVIEHISDGQVDEMSDYESSNVSATDADGDALTWTLTVTDTQNGNILPWTILDTNSVNTKKIKGMLPSVNSNTNPSDIINVEIDVSDGKATTKQNYQVIDNNLVDVSGTLNQSGVVRFYDSNKNIIKIKSADSDETIIHDLSGNAIGVTTKSSSPNNFSVKLEEIVNNNDKIFLQAGSNVSGTNVLATYIRTVDLQAIDQTPITDIRANPITAVQNPNPSKGENFSRENYKRFLAKINFDPVTGLQKFDQSYLDNFKGVKIIKKNPNGNDSFTDIQFLKIQGKGDIGKWYGKDSISITEGDSSQINYYLSNYYLVIEPNETLGDGIFGSSSPGLIQLNSSYPIIDYVLLHEAGHASSVALFEANDPSNPENTKIVYYPFTVMNSNISQFELPISLNDAKADLKAEKDINNKTYLKGEKIDNVMIYDWGFSSP